MKSVEILGYKRANLKKSEVKQLREQANVPCVLYGGNEHVQFYAPMIFFRELIYTPDAYIVNLNVEGEEYKAVLQEVQFHPVSEIILHADFLVLDETKPVRMDIPVKIVGTSPGVQIGGKLVSKVRKLKVRALPKDLPENVIIDVSNLELGKSVKVKDIAKAGYEILNSPNIPVVSVEIPRALKGKQTGATE
ncbi:MAG: 50S ribosomal protein L25/general stress protein Ctc [Cytophagales bacterium]|nr:MAG: 50S ribosomal protein L25/general stress protein Ctc [Cytophagales bacterium]